MNRTCPNCGREIAVINGGEARGMLLATHRRHTGANRRGVAITTICEASLTGAARAVALRANRIEALLRDEAPNSDLVELR